MTNYARMYRFGITPWERYGTVAAASITALLDREATGRSRPFGGTGWAGGPEATLSCLALSGRRPAMPRSAHSCRIADAAHRDIYVSSCLIIRNLASPAGLRLVAGTPEFSHRETAACCRS